MSGNWPEGDDRDLSRDSTTPTSDQEPTAPVFAPTGRFETTHDEHTRLLPSENGAAQPAPIARRRTGVLGAAILAGALVVGGSAGYGGAALYHSGHDSAALDSSTNSSTNAVPSGTVTGTSAIETVAKQLLPSVVQLNVSGQNESGTGTGIILDSSGTILTNNHVASVAADGGTIEVAFNDGKTAKATIVGTDPVTDLAVVKADNVSGLTPAKIGNSDAVQVGQTVVAIGSPYGLGSTVTSGIVSALHRAVTVATSEQAPQGQDPFGFGQQQPPASTVYPAIQTDAAINPGNSGGPLVNLAGEVIGINSSIQTAGDNSGAQGGSIGLGFAIPMNEAMPIVQQIIKGEKPTHARLGVEVADYADGNGAVVKTVESGAAAAKAGLRPNDVITKVDGQVIANSDDLIATIRGERPGQTATLTVLRGSRTSTIKAILGSDAATTKS